MSFRVASGRAAQLLGSRLPRCSSQCRATARSPGIVPWYQMRAPVTDDIGGGCQTLAALLAGSGDCHQPPLSCRLPGASGLHSATSSPAAATRHRQVHIAAANTYSGNLPATTSMPAAAVVSFPPTVAEGTCLITRHQDDEVKTRQLQPRRNATATTAAVRTVISDDEPSERPRDDDRRREFLVMLHERSMVRILSYMAKRWQGTGDERLWLSLAADLKDEAAGDVERLEESLRRLECVLMFVTLAGGTPSERALRCLAAKMDPGTMDLTDAEREAFLDRLQQPFKTRWDIVVAKLVLLRLNEWESLAAGGNSGALLLPGSHCADGSWSRVVTLEHIIPRAMSPDSQWMLDFGEDGHAEWFDRLPNLLLVGSALNSKLGNRDFADKCARFRKEPPGLSAHFPLTRQAYGTDNVVAGMTSSEMERRLQDLLDLAGEVWFA